jgi:hypothetical protein
MALDTLTHRCLSCCTTNLTTNDCCQCSSSWDGKFKFPIEFFNPKTSFPGFCLHPLVTPSTPFPGWLKFPIDKIRNKFYDFTSSRQTIFIIACILVLISIIICLITISLRQLFYSNLSSRQEHNNVEYVMLQNLDDNDDEEPRSISTNGHSKKLLSNQTTISMNNVEET